MRELLGIYAKGFAMGAADVVPGVSGATIALILGIYDRLIHAITAIDPRRLRPGMAFHDAEARSEFVRELERMDATFLLALGLGVASAVVVLASAMHLAVTQVPVPTYAFFFGLIAASAIVLYRQVDPWTPRRVAVSVGAIAIAVAVTGVTGASASHGFPMVFLAGAIAICAMVLPGVSGAFFLLILGQYEYMTGVLSDFTGAVLGGGSPDALVESGSVIAVFGVGAVVGLFSMAHAVRFALDRFYVTTMAALVSLMVGSLRLPLEAVLDGLGETTAGDPVWAAVGGVIGVAVVLVLDRFTAELEYQ